MRIYIHFFLMTYFSFLTCFELLAETVGADTYMIKKHESLDSLAIKLLPRFEVKYNKRINELKKDLVEWNPHIKTWDNVPLYSNIYIEYPYSPYISYPYAPKLVAGKNINIVNTDSETPFGDNRFTLFGMYTASTGNFQEQLTGQEGSITSSQNSPISLGIGSTFFLDKNIQIINSSFYWSSLQKSNLTGTTNSASLEIKPEYGGSVYYQQLTPWNEVALYGGIDYEQFSTFNTSAYIGDGVPLAFNQNNLFYGTVGVARSFIWGEQKVSLKGSFSQSLKSDTTSSNSGDKFEGKRLLFFSSLKGDGRFSYHLLYKRHMLEGPTKLTINRIGIGLGVVLF